MSVTAYPLTWPEGWPRTLAHRRADSRKRWGKGEGSKRRPWSFAESRDELYNELDRYGARDLVLSSDFRLTAYGLPSKNYGVPDDPGVAIYFTYKGKSMAMAQDGHTRAEENMRALALVLKYLRGVADLGGGTMMEKAFSGFAALPAQRGSQWWEVLGVGRTALPADIEAAHRALAKKHHPDVPGGSTDMMQKINAAKVAGLAERG